MDIDWSSEDLAFRDSVRQFLREKFTPELRARSQRISGVFAPPDVGCEWHQVLYAQGWAAPTWPNEYGGPGWSGVQRYIFYTECARAGTPVLPGMGVRMCGPVIMRFGTAEQKEFFL